MPRKNSWKVGKVVRKVQGLSNEAKPQKDAGKRCPSYGAGIDPQEGGGTTPPTSSLLPERAHEVYLMITSGAVLAQRAQ